MGTTEQMWFLIAIGGFLVFFEGAIAYIAKGIFRWFKWNASENIIKVIVGLIIYVVAVVFLFRVAPGT
jgi:hypothetical protein